MLNKTTLEPSTFPSILDTDPSALDAVVAQKLARKTGLSLAVASAVAVANGLGPSGGRAH